MLAHRYEAAFQTPRRLGLKIVIGSNPETGHSCPASAEPNSGVDATRSLCGAGPSLSGARSFLGGEFRCHGHSGDGVTIGDRRQPGRSRSRGWQIPNSALADHGVSAWQIPNFATIGR